MLFFIRSVFVIGFVLALFSNELRAGSLSLLTTAKSDSEQYFVNELGLSSDLISIRLEKAFSKRESDLREAIHESARLFLVLEKALSHLGQGLRGNVRAFHLSSKIADWQSLLVQLQIAVERDLSGKFERRLKDSEEFLVRQKTAEEMLIRFRELVVFAFISVYAVDWSRDFYLSYQLEFNKMSKNSLAKIKSYVEGSHFMCRILFLDLSGYSSN